MVLSVCRLGQTNTVTNVNRTVTTFFASPPLSLRLAIRPPHPDCCAIRPLLARRGEESRSPALEILHGALVLLRGGTAGKGAEIAPLAGLRILFTRIEPVFSGREFANHDTGSG